MLTERQLNGSGELPERWSAKRKTEIVLRLLRGEDLGQISREIQVAPQVIEEWRRAFLAGAEAGLKKRGGDPLESELVRTRAKLGETLMRLELAEMLLEKRGYMDDLKRLRRSENS
jgi:transposase